MKIKTEELVVVEDELFDQIPIKTENTPLHNFDDEDFLYQERYRATESKKSLAIGNTWQVPLEDIRSYKTKMATAIEYMRNNGIKAHYEYDYMTPVIELNIPKDKPEVHNRQYITIESIEPIFISDLDTGEAPYHNPYYATYPSTKNKNRGDYLGRIDQYDEFGNLDEEESIYFNNRSISVPRKHTDRMTVYMGDPQWNYNDRLLNIEITGFNQSGKEIKATIKADKEADIEILKVTTKDRYFYLIPVLQYGERYIYNRYNKNDKMLNIKERTNIRKLYNFKEAGFNKDGMYEVPTTINKEKEEVSIQKRHICIREDEYYLSI